MRRGKDPRRGRESGRRDEVFFEDEGYTEDDSFFDDPSSEDAPGPKAAGGFDWDAAAGQEDDEDFEAAPARRPPSRRAPAPVVKAKKTLMDLAAPVVGFAALLPRDGEAGAAQPEYQAYRDGVLAALRALESEAAEHGIEGEDAREAGYALSLFLDGQVLESVWIEKDRWATEPLHVVLHQDPAGGVNFFERLGRLGERQGAVKEVFLVCLALGFRGKYAELEPTEQAAQIGALRQSVLRQIHPTPLDERRALFPEAYAKAEAIVDEVPPPPRWWLVTSLGVVAVCALIWLALFWFAGRTPEGAIETLETELRPPLAGVTAPATSPAADTAPRDEEEGQ